MWLKKREKVNGDSAEALENVYMILLLHKFKISILSPIKKSLNKKDGLEKLKNKTHLHTAYKTHFRSQNTQTESEGTEKGVSLKR